MSLSRSSGVRPVLDCTGDDGKTRQSDAANCDINKIMARWVREGGPSEEDLRNGRPSYGDFTNATDYQTAMNRVVEAKAAFDALPVKVRNACDNDPARFLEMVHDVNQAELLVEAGLDVEIAPAASPVAVEPEPEGTPAKEGSSTE